MKSKEDNEDTLPCKADELECTIGCKGEEKQKEEDTLAGERFKLMVIKQDISFACCLVFWLLCEEWKQHEAKQRQKTIQRTCRWLASR